VRGVSVLHIAVNSMSLRENVHVIVGGISRQRASDWRSYFYHRDGHFSRVQTGRVAAR